MDQGGGGRQQPVDDGEGGDTSVLRVLAVLQVPDAGLFPVLPVWTAGAVSRMMLED